MSEEGIISTELAAKIAELQRLDEIDRKRGLARAEAAVPPYQDLIQLGPIPEEYTAVPRPREIGPPERSPWAQGKSPDEILGWHGMKFGGGPSGPGSTVPAVEDARLRAIGARAAARRHFRDDPSSRALVAFEKATDDWRDEYRRAADYNHPWMPAMRERDRLLEEARAQEAARQSGLSETFGTPEERARTILALTDLAR